MLEEAITGDFAIIRSLKADKYGNAVFNKSARNFNVDIATAGKTTILETEEIVDQIDPDQVHLPGIYVNRIF